MHRILYIDDEPGLLEIAKLFLEGMDDFSVDVVTSGDDALRSISSQSYSAIISDYQMPGMDGIALLKAVRNRDSSLPFILFTGRGREEVVIEAINNGVDFYLQKGGDPKAQFAELAHKIRQAIARRQAELSLIESEKRLADIIDFLPDATFAIDRLGRVIAWNRAIEEMTGIPAADMLGKGDYEYAIPFYGSRRQILIDLIFESDDSIARKYAHIVHEKDLLIADTTLPRPQGRIVTLMGKASPLYDRQGEVIGAIESIRDITAMKAVEEELRAANEQLSASQEELQAQFEALMQSEKQIRESEAKYRELAELLPQMVFEADLDFKVTYANRYVLQSIGITEEHIIKGISGLSYIDPTDHDRLRENAGRVIRGEPVGNPEYTAVRTDGTKFPVLIYTSPVYRDGKILGFRGVIIDISARKKAENALRESERFLSETQKIARLGGWKANPGTDYLEWTDGIYDIIEAPRSYHPGFTEGTKYFAPEDIAVIREKVVACLSNGIPFTMEARIIADSGKQVWTELRGLAPVTEGTRSYVIGTLQDITGRKKAEEALRESEERFKTLFDKSAEPQLLIDGTGKVTDCNAAFLTLFALKGKDLILGHAPEDFAPEFQPDGVRSAERGDEIFARVMNEGHVRYEWAHVKHDAARTPILTEVILTLIPISGQPVIHGSIRDITEQKKAEDELRTHEATLASIFRAAPIGIGLVSARVMQRVNDRLCEMTGYSAEELVGKSARILYPSDKEFDWVGQEKYDQIRKSGTGTVETRWKRKDGAIRDVLLSSTPLEPDNHVAGITFTALDITERKQAESELHSTNEQLAANEEELRGQYEELAGAQDELRLQQQQMEEIAGTVPGVVYQFYARADGTMGMYDISGRAPDVFGISSESPDFFKRFTGQIDPRDRDAFINSIKEVVRLQSPWNFEGRFIKPSGETIWFQGISHPIVRGTEIIFSGVMLDITDRKLSEVQLHESEAKYRTLIETTSTGFVILDELGRVMDANPEYVRLSGHNNLGEIAGRSVLEWTATAEKDKNTDAFRQCLKDGYIRNLEIDYVDASGDFIPIEINATVLHSHDTVQVLTLCRNISNRRKTQKALQEGEAKYRTVVEQSQDGIFIAQDGLLIFHNPSFATMTGYNSAELPGRSIADLIAPEDRDLVLTRHRERLHGKALPEVYDFSVLHRDGKTRIKVRMNITSATIGGKPATIGTLHKCNG